MTTGEPWKEYTAPSEPEGPWSEYAKPATTTPEPVDPDPGFVGAYKRGFKRTLPETKALAGAATAAIGGLVGADGVRDYGLDVYKRNMAEADAGGNSSFADVRSGKTGVGTYFGDVLGNFSGQALESAVAASAGAVAGTEAPGVGNVVGAVGGVVAKGAVKRAIFKEAAALATEEAGKALVKRRLQQIGGGALASYGLNAGQETGIIYGQRATDAADQGRALGFKDSAAAIGGGAVAGGIDTLAEGLNVSRLVGGASKAPGLARRVLTGAAEGAVTEGGTEAAQAVIERSAAGQDLTSPEALNDYLENAVAGAVGGGVIGGGSGIRRRAIAPAAEAPVPEPQPQQELAPEMLALPAPDRIAVAPDGTATPGAGGPPEVYADPEMRFPQGRGMSGIGALPPRTLPTGQPLPDPGNGVLSRVVNAGDANGALATADAQRRAQEAVALTQAGEKDNAALESEVAAAEKAAEPAKPQKKTETEPTQKRQPITFDSATGEILQQGDLPLGEALPVNQRQLVPKTPRDPEAARAYITAELDALRPPENKMVASSFGLTMREASELQNEIQRARRPARSTAPEATPAAAAAPIAAPAPVADAPAPVSTPEAAPLAATPQNIDAAPAAGIPSYDTTDEVLDSDITPASGGPFTDRGAAEVNARRAGPTAAVIPVQGGFVVRMPQPQEAANDTAGAGRGQEPVAAGGPASPAVDQNGGTQGEAAAPAPVAPTKAAPELVTVTDVYGDQHRVAKADLDGTKKTLVTYTKAGKVKESSRAGTYRILRDNLDTDGAQRAAMPAPKEILRPNAKSERDSGFTSIAAVKKAIAKAGRQESEYDIVQRGGGYVGVRKSPASGVSDAPAVQQEKPRGNEETGKEGGAQEVSAEKGKRAEKGKSVRRQKGGTVRVGEGSGAAEVRQDGENVEAGQPVLVNDRRSNASERERIAALPLDARDAEITKLREANAELQRQVDSDSLTGTRSRAAFNRDAPNAGGVAIIDIKQFKGYNTVGGQTGGDQVLRHIGAAMNAAEGDGATAFRHGGDEFAFLADSPDAARAAAERLAKHMANIRLTLELDGKTYSVQGVEFNYGVGSNEKLADTDLSSRKGEYDRNALPAGVRDQSVVGPSAEAAAPGRESDRREKPTGEVAPASADAQRADLRKALDAHLEGNDTPADIADAVEALLDDGLDAPALKSALDAYRTEQEDQVEFGFRNDMDGADSAFIAAVEAELGTPPVNPISAAAAEAATSSANDLAAPTEAQIEAGNYKKGHVRFNGLDVSIETPAGERRRPEWPPLANHYGYLKRTDGADGEQVDVFLSDQAADASLPVFVIDQVNKDGSFDEHKVMLGFPNERAARKAYLANYSKGWNGLGAITEQSLDGFKEWLTTDTTQPLVPQQPKTRVVKGKAEYKVFDQRQIKSATGNSGAFDAANQSIVASRAPATGTGAQAQTFEATRAQVADIISGWKGDAPKVELHATAETLPAFAKADPDYKTAEGLYDRATGTVHLVAANIHAGYDATNKRRVTAAQRLQQVLAHEAIGHYGIEAITGKPLWAQIGQTVATMRGSGKHQALFAEVDRRYGAPPAGALPDLYVQEAVAVMTEKGVRNSITDRIVAALRRFWRSLGGFAAFSEAELRQHIIDATRGVQTTAPAPGVYGQKLTGAAFASTGNFKRWFGDSKVVNEDGSPKVVYHGTTADFDTFDLESSDDGDFGPGLYFTDQPAAANTYAQGDGGRVVPVYLNLRNPATNAVLNSEEARDVMDDGGMDGEGLKDWLTEQGYDGIAFTHAAKNGNPSGVEYVVFDPTQIKSATANNGEFSPTEASILFSKPDTAAADPGKITLSAGSKRSVKDILDKVAGKLTDLKPGLLSTIPLNYLADYAPKSMPAVKQFIELRQQLETFRNKQHQVFDTIAQDWLRFATKPGWRGLLTGSVSPQGQALSDLMHDTTIAGVDPTLPAATYKDDATKLAQHKELAARFAALPDDGKKLYSTVRDAYAKQADDVEKALVANFTKAADYRKVQAQREFEARIEDINDGPETEAKKVELREAATQRRDSAIRTADSSARGKQIALRQKFESMRVEQPYFPLKRFGKYFVAAKRDGKTVSFSKFEAFNEAKAYAAEQSKAGLSVSIGLDTEKDAIRNAIDPRFIAEIDDILAEHVDDDVRDAIYQRYLESLPDLSLRKSFIHRKKTPGYHPDALRSFGSTMFHGSYQLARLKYGLDMTEAHQVAEDQARRNSPVQGMALANEIGKRLAWVMNPQGSSTAQALTGAAFVWSLGANPAHLFLNATQTAMLGVPILGSKYGFGQTTSAIGRAVKDFAVGKGEVERANLTHDEHRAMKTFFDSGLIDKTQSHDLAGVGETGAEYSAMRQRVMSKLGWFFHQSERFNREVTALAAYRLARGKGESHDAAARSAADNTWSIHFDYSAANRPRVMQGDLPKVLFVFRNYNVNMLYRLFRDIHTAFKGETKESRVEAAKQLGAMFGMYGLFAGLAGVPFYGLAMTLAGLFDDDDEPFDAETRFRQGIAEHLGPDVARYLLGGVPGGLVGVDLTDRIGMPNLWFRAPDRELEGRDAYYYWMEQLTGAVPGIAKNLFTGLQQVHEGNIQRGVETMLPNLLKSPVKALRYINDGGQATSLTGDKVADVGAGGVIKQALGFTPGEVSEQYRENSALKNAEAKVQKRRQQIINRFAMAREQGDRDGMQEAQESMQRFNATNPAFRITPDTLRRSLRTRAKNEQLNEGGIVMSRRLKALAAQAAQTGGED